MQPFEYTPRRDKRICRLLHLFMKRFLKYLVFLCLLTAMLIPLIQVSKSYIRDIVVQNLTRNLQESTDILEHDISKAHQMISILASKESFQKLIKDSGGLPLEHYVYLSELQTSLLVYGMSAPAIEQRIQEVMLGWFSLYLGIGLSIITILTFLYSIPPPNSSAYFP